MGVDEVTSNVPGDAPIFAEFDAAERSAFLSAATRVRFRKGHVLLRMGDVNTSLFVIATGSVSVFRVLPTGREEPLTSLGRGETFGEMSFITGEPTTAKLITAEPTEVLEISAERLAELAREQPRIWGKMWKSFALLLSHRLSQTNDLIERYIDLNQSMVDNPWL